MRRQIPNQRTKQISEKKKKKTLKERVISNLLDKEFNNGHKYAYQFWEKNGWTQWELKKKGRKYKKVQNISYNWTKK